MLNNKTFYPTPERLIDKMIARIQGHPKKILEPSAGKGDLIERLLKRFDRYSRPDISAIESDPELQATLRGKGFKLIDTDFLAYTGPDKYDLIIANPPFDDGDKHLHKALDIMYRGQIISLLNAETIRNPFNNSRKLLVRRLEELGASIEFIPNAFRDAERKTDVEVALVYIKIDRKVEDDLFAGADDWAPDNSEQFSEKHEVSTGKTVVELVAEYNEIIKAGTDTILHYYRNYRKIGRHLKLNDIDNKNRTYSTDDLTTMLQDSVNDLLRTVRTAFWRRTLDLKEVRSRLTKKKQEEFEEALKDRCHMDFTENNIRQFVLNLIGSYEKTLTEAVLDIFDMFTIRHSYHGGPNEKNIHYFNGWKTNKAFKVGKRVVIPLYGDYGGAFFDWGKWRLGYRVAETLRDIDLVMSYFNGGGDYLTLPDAIHAAFSQDQNSGQSTFFKFICHKKGTIHLTFRDMDILRRFNVVACRGKGWLPGDYGAKSYQQLTIDEKAVADSFEGEDSYTKHMDQPLFRAQEHCPGLEYKKVA